MSRGWLALFVAAAVVAAPAPAVAQTPLIIKFSHVVAENTPKGRAALAFKREAERLLPGKVKVEVYANATLFGDANEMEALLFGDVQVLATSLSKFDKFTMKLQLFDLPFLFDDEKALDRFQRSAPGTALLRSMLSKNYLGLAYWHNGLKQISANKPLLDPADARGLKVRIQDSELLAKQFKALGAIAYKMPFEDVLPALESGVVDGQENTWSNIFSQGFHKVQKHISATNHGVIDYMVLVNARWWGGLPKDIRAGLEAAMQVATRVNNDIASKLNDEARDKIAASGLTTIHSMSADKRADWKWAMAPVWQAFEAFIGKDLIDAARKSNLPTVN